MTSTGSTPRRPKFRRQAGTGLAPPSWPVLSVCQMAAVRARTRYRMRARTPETWVGWGSAAHKMSPNWEKRR
jgi:hypothetical protein